MKKKVVTKPKALKPFTKKELAKVKVGQYVRCCRENVYYKTIKGEKYKVMDLDIDCLCIKTKMGLFWMHYNAFSKAKKKIG